MSVRGYSDMPDVQTPLPEATRERRYRQAALLLIKWTSEDPRYDELAGSRLEQELKEASLRCEEEDDTAA